MSWLTVRSWNHRMSASYKRCRITDVVVTGFDSIYFAVDHLVLIFLSDYILPIVSNTVSSQWSYI